jgi:ribosome-associated protein
MRPLGDPFSRRGPPLLNFGTLSSGRIRPPSQDYPSSVSKARPQASASPSAGPDRALALARLTARIAAETRGSEILILDLRELTPVVDYFVIATGSSRRQMHAMADEIEKVVKHDLHDRKRGAEGYEEGRWIVLDYGDVMVHLFDPEARGYWDLEGLWSDAARVPVPEPTGDAGAAAR